MTGDVKSVLERERARKRVKSGKIYTCYLKYTEQSEFCEQYVSYEKFRVFSTKMCSALIENRISLVQSQFFPKDKNKQTKTVVVN